MGCVSSSLTDPWKPPTACTWIVTFAMRSRGRVALEGDARNSKSEDAGGARTLTVEGSRLRRVGWADEREVKRKAPSRRSTKMLLDRASSRLCLVLIGGQLPIAL